MNKSVFIDVLAATIYIIAGGFTGTFFGSDFATIMLPITVYILFVILITHSLCDDEEKRLIDLNNIALLSYGCSYLIFGLINPYINDGYQAFFIFLGLLVIFLAVFIFLLFKFTTKSWWKK